MRLLFLATALIFAAGTALAQSKVPVFLKNTPNDNDSVGQQLVFEIKEAIRGSHGFRLVEEYARRVADALGLGG